MITINIDKAKTIAHDARRAARSLEFKPLDVKTTLPSEAAQAEADRQAVREKYAYLQTSIDLAEDVDKLSNIVKEINNVTF